MILYRITSKAYVRDLSGTGAMLYGGRWNRRGTRMLYTSGSLSLAALETIATLSPARLGQTLYCVELDFPDDLTVDQVSGLPESWNTYPHIPETAAMGSAFMKNGGLCLRVPGALIPSEYNYLINPIHDDFLQVKLRDARPMILDKRLVVPRD